MFNVLVSCPGDGKICYELPIVGTETIWIVIETFCFYQYLYATVFYLAGMVIKSACMPTKQISDFKKAVLDTVNYASINLTWFSLNFVLCTMPPLCIYVMEHQTEGKLNQNTESYIGQMYLLWAVHVITFIPKMRIFKIKRKGVDTPPDLVNDDDFQRAPDEKINVLADLVGDDDSF